MGSHTVATTGTISGLAENTQINVVALALATMSQGAAAPTASSTGLSSTAGIWWHDTADGTVRVRNQADNAWITIGTLNETTNTFAAAGGGSGGGGLPTSGGTLTGQLIVQSGGINIQAGGLTIGASGASITGNTSVTGTFSVTGQATFSVGATFGAGITVNGQIVSSSGGFKFPDGSVQTTAVNASAFLTSSALGGYAPLASPNFSGAPHAPTPGATTGNNQIATCDWVAARIMQALTTYQSGGGVTGGGAEGGGGSG